MIDLTICPECGHLAEVEWRTVLDSSDGPVEHALVSCVRRHWSLLPMGSPDPVRGSLGATGSASKRRHRHARHVPWARLPSSMWQRVLSSRRWRG